MVLDSLEIYFNTAFPEIALIRVLFQRLTCHEMPRRVQLVQLAYIVANFSLEWISTLVHRSNIDLGA